MNLNDAKSLVQEWVMEEASGIPGFQGAFHHGSAVWQSGDTELKPTSDMDVMVVVDNPNPPLKLGKLRHRDVLFDVTWLPWNDVQTPQQVLANHSLAGSLRDPGIIADPTGHLVDLQRDVARHFADRRWVEARCNSVQDRLLRNLESVQPERPLHDQVMAWLFGTGLTTHLLLVAGLRNPTVRKRYLAVRELLADAGHQVLYDDLLALLGCASMNPARVEHHLNAVGEAFDAAAEVIRTPVFFASDISQAARPISIDGSQELIDKGDHREAVFWIAATWCRCQHILFHDAPELLDRFDPAFQELLNDLGVASLPDLRRRGAEVEAALPDIWKVAEAMIADNPDVKDG